MRCDKRDHTDEVIEAIGRGRGVNRIVPDIVQRMLLAGVAVDSPADAAVLHPALLGSPDAYESAFRRAGFNRQNPIDITYRGMTVKSARYGKGGRGHGVHTAYWLKGEAAIIRATLEQALGPLAV
jgi:hypothetical protein